MHAVNQRGLIAMMSLWLALGACREQTATPHSVSLNRDRATRVLVQDELQSARQLRLADSPLLTVGGLAKDTSIELRHSNGFLNAAPSTNGELAIIELDRLRFFGADGVHRISLGRQGSGPNEFRGLSHACRSRGDTVVAYDYGLRRLTIATSDGRWVRQIPVEKIGQLPADGCLADGRIILKPFAGSADATIHLLTLQGEVVARINADYDTDPNRRITVFARGREVWRADPLQQEVIGLDQGGHVVRILTLRDALKRMTDAEALANSPEGARAGSRPKSGDVISAKPTYWPLFESAKDGGDRIWFEETVRDGGFAPSVWYAVGDDGRLVGKLSLRFDGDIVPPVVVRFQGDSVWLLRRNAEGIATFSLYRILGQSR
ncbi:MAG: hypothetical protein K2R93_06425 [Gemmatimonadaceae bacterium]|nr:hypothetical protein [Gemmatimonadaceae bacterium]